MQENYRNKDIKKDKQTHSVINLQPSLYNVLYGLPVMHKGKFVCIHGFPPVIKKKYNFLFCFPGIHLAIMDTVNLPIRSLFSLFCLFLYLLCVSIAGSSLDDTQLPELPSQQRQHGAVDVVQADTRGAQ